ncbi:MAG: hypothetical protein J7M25_09030, partial [Deltaproteobacteria bacterium]|nr:hypothetical protein [Deltaproteobacteria bacterium]
HRIYCDSMSMQKRSAAGIGWVLHTANREPGPAMGGKGRRMAGTGDGGQGPAMGGKGRRVAGTGDGWQGPAMGGKGRRMAGAMDGRVMLFGPSVLVSAVLVSVGEQTRRCLYSLSVSSGRRATWIWCCDFVH